MPETPGLSRFLHLADTTAYPGRDTLDIVYMDLVSDPEKEARQVRGEAALSPRRRVWLYTAAAAPELQFDDQVLTPVEPGAAAAVAPRWLDYGVVEELLREHGRFGQLRVRGMDWRQAQDAWLLVTERLDVEPGDSLESAEERFYGLPRRELGRSTITPSTVTVGAPAVYEVTYQAGNRGLPAGARVRFGVAHQLGAPQAEDPAADGYVEVIAAGAAAELETIRPATESHEKRDIIYRLPEGLPPAGKLEVRYRTESTYLPACLLEGTRRRYWYDIIAPLTVDINLLGGGTFAPLPRESGHRVRYVPGRAERVHLHLPGRRRDGRGLTLVGILTDAFRNPVRRAAPLPLALRLTGDAEMELDGPARRYDAAHRFSLPLPELAPGVYRVEARDPATGEVLAVSNPLEILAPTDEREEIFWGEIHGHTEMSDGTGRFEEMFRHARDVGALDFAAGADHACYFSDNEWEWMQDVVNRFHRPEQFCTLIGYEWAGEQGHRNVHGSGERLELYRGMYRPTRRLDAVYHPFRGRRDVVAGPHTCHTGDFWAHHDPAVERYMEIYSVWGYFEDLAWELLNQGARIGFTGGGDCHDGRVSFAGEHPERNGEIGAGFFPGLKFRCGATAALLPRLDRPELIEALRERRIYATTGARILLDVAVAGTGMGQAGACDGAPVVAAAAHGQAEIAALEVIRDGRSVHRHAPESPDAELSWTDGTADAGEHWYVIRVEQADGHVAWSSPVWIVVK